MVKIKEENAMANQGGKEYSKKDFKFKSITASYPGLEGFPCNKMASHPGYEGLESRDKEEIASHIGFEGLPCNKNEMASHSGLQELPPEILLRILHLLPFDSVVRISSVSRGLHIVAQDETLWRRLFLKNFGWKTLGQPCIEEGKRWKERFKKEYSQVYN